MSQIAATNSYFKNFNQINLSSFTVYPFNKELPIMNGINLHLAHTNKKKNNIL